MHAGEGHAETGQRLEDAGLGGQVPPELSHASPTQGRKRPGTDAPESWRSRAHLHFGFSPATQNLAMDFVVVCSGCRRTRTQPRVPAMNTGSVLSTFTP